MFLCNNPAKKDEKKKKKTNLKKKTFQNWSKHKRWKIVWSLYNLYLPTPPPWAGCDTKSTFKRSLISLNSGFSFSSIDCYIKFKEPNLPYYLLIAGGRIIGCTSFPRVLALCGIQIALSRIWTRVAVSIYYDGNHYTTSACDLFFPSELDSKRKHIFCIY